MLTFPFESLPPEIQTLVLYWVDDTTYKVLPLVSKNVNELSQLPMVKEGRIIWRHYRHDNDLVLIGLIATSSGLRVTRRITFHNGIMDHYQVLEETPIASITYLRGQPVDVELTSGSLVRDHCIVRLGTRGPHVEAERVKHFTRGLITLEYAILSNGQLEYYRVYKIKNETSVMQLWIIREFSGYDISIRDDGILPSWTEVQGLMEGQIAVPQESLLTRSKRDYQEVIRSYHSRPFDKPEAYDLTTTTSYSNYITYSRPH